MSLRALQSKRTEIVREMRGLIDAPKGEAGDLSTEQTQRFDVLKSELGKVDADIERRQLVDAAEREAEGISVTGDKHLDRECRSYNLLRAIQGRLGLRVDDAHEREISAELEHREQRNTEGLLVPYSGIFEVRAAGAITSTAPAAGPGGTLIPTDYRPDQYVDPLREADPLAGLGITHLSGLVGNVEIPAAKTGTTVGWFSENSSIPQADMSFRSIGLSPKHCGAWAEYSLNMLKQSSPDIEGLLKADLAQSVALEVARTIINGTGTNNEPTGILNTTGINSIAAPAEVMDYVPSLIAKLFEKNISNIAFLGKGTLKETVDKLLTTDKLPVGEAAFFRNAKHVWTNLIPAASSDLIAGDFSQIIVGHWGSVEILTNPFMESAYKKGNVALRIILSMDVAVRHAEAFAVFNGE